MKNHTYFYVFVPLVSALLGAIIGSISTHILKWIEDNRTEIKKTSRKIYYKIFPELKYFFLCDNTSEKPSFSKLKVNEMKKRIENILEENILEENIDFLDKKLFSIYYYNLKSDEYYDSLGYSEFININHLEVFSKILMCMHSVFKKPSMIDKKLLKDVDELIYCYKTWFLLMDKFQDWTLVDNILKGRCLFKKSFKEIYGNKLFHKLLNCENVDDVEFYEVFSKYCIDEISIPKEIFTKNKYLK